MLAELAPTARQRERANNGRGAPKMAPATVAARYNRQKHFLIPQHDFRV